MNKAVAEVIAGVIPNKMAKNRWRGILRYGPIRALKLKKKLRYKENVQPQYYLAVCAIAKNEGPYFTEWIEWHRALGVEKFYIYDNESSDNTEEILAPYIESGLVDYVFWPGRKQQLVAYDNCFERHRFDARWIAVIDLDEFIVPVKDRTIPELLKRFENFAALEINWLVYGSGGAQKRVPGTIMERFERHSVSDHILNRQVKSIVDPQRIFSFIGCHEAARISNRAATPDGKPVKQCFRDRTPQHDVVRINHYAVKSYEEFLEKRARGRARRLDLRNLDYFDKYDLNNIED